MFYTPINFLLLQIETYINQAIFQENKQEDLIIPHFGAMNAMQMQAFRQVP